MHLQVAQNWADRTQNKTIAAQGIKGKFSWCQQAEETTQGFAKSIWAVLKGIPLITMSTEAVTKAVMF